MTSSKDYLQRHAEVHNRRPDKAQSNYRLYLSHWGSRKLSTITRRDVQALHAKLGREKGRVTANIAVRLLRAMINKAIEWELWDKANPARGIKLFPEDARDRFLQPDELPRFFQTVADEPNETIRDYVLVSLLTGARRSNVLAMRWEEVSLERGEWRISTTKSGKAHTLWSDDAVTTGLGIAEGIETVLGLATAYHPVWACIDAGNLAALPVLGGIESLLIAADHDEPGLRAAHTCADRWAEDDREVRVYVPQSTGTDVCDEVAA
jgi:Toprim domain/Phage integrase family